MPSLFHAKLHYQLSLFGSAFNDIFRNYVLKSKAVIGYSEHRKVRAVFVTALQSYVGTEILMTFPSALYLNIEFKKFLQGRERARNYWQKGWF